MPKGSTGGANGGGYDAYKGRVRIDKHRGWCMDHIHRTVQQWFARGGKFSHTRTSGTYDAQAEELLHDAFGKQCITRHGASNLLKMYAENNNREAGKYCDTVRATFLRTQGLKTQGVLRLEWQS